MDHETAIETRAAERYCHGELTPEERDQFEEHFFLCRECAEEVRWEQIFAANAKAVLREQSRRKPWRDTLRRWLSALQVQPALAASALANAVLLVGLGYLSLSVLPAHRNQLVRSQRPQLTAAVVVPTTVRSSLDTVRIPRNQPLIPLSFALPQPYPQYTYEVTREGGGVRMSETVPAPAASAEELLLTIPTAGLTPGSYLVVLRGVGSGTPSEIGRYKFQLE